jgi:hypothetical protein
MSLPLKRFPNLTVSHNSSFWSHHLFSLLLLLLLPISLPLPSFLPFLLLLVLICPHLPLLIYGIKVYYFIRQFDFQNGPLHGDMPETKPRHKNHNAICHVQATCTARRRLKLAILVFQLSKTERVQDGAATFWEAVADLKN